MAALELEFCGLIYLALLKVIVYVHPFLGAFLGLVFCFFGGFLKQIQVYFS